ATSSVSHPAPPPVSRTNASSLQPDGGPGAARPRSPRCVASGPDAKVSPTLRQRRGNGAVVHLSQELELREIHMKTASAKAAFRRRPGASDGVLVSPEWLQAHLSDPHLRLLEVEVGQAASANWHMAGGGL